MMWDSPIKAGRIHRVLCAVRRFPIGEGEPHVIMHDHRRVRA